MTKQKLLKDLYPQASEDALDMMRVMLEFNPDKVRAAAPRSLPRAKSRTKQKTKKRATFARTSLGLTLARALYFSQRMSAAEAMKHPYVAKFHDAANEPVLTEAIRYLPTCPPAPCHARTPY